MEYILQAKVGQTRVLSTCILRLSVPMVIYWGVQAQCSQVVREALWCKAIGAYTGRQVTVCAIALKDIVASKHTEPPQQSARTARCFTISYRASELHPISEDI